jgi:hypothetical protein
MKDDDDTMCYRSELEAAVKAEREACAKLAAEPQFWPMPSFTHQPSDRTMGRIEGEKEMSRRITAAIQARGQDPMPLFDDWPGGWKK